MIREPIKREFIHQNKNIEMTIMKEKPINNKIHSDITRRLRKTEKSLKKRTFFRFFFSKKMSFLKNVISREKSD